LDGPLRDGAEGPEAQQTLCEALSLSEGDVVRAVRYELARSVEDVLARRHRALFLDARAAQAVAPTVARILARELGYDATWCEAQCRSFSALAAGYL